MLRINRNARLPFNRQRDQQSRLFPFFAIKRDLFSIGRSLDLEVVVDHDDFESFFELWANVAGEHVFAIARYRPWYIAIDRPTTWKFNDDDLYAPVHARHGAQGRAEIFAALAENLALTSAEILFLDDDEQVAPRPHYLPSTP